MSYSRNRTVLGKAADYEINLVQTNAHSHYVTVSHEQKDFISLPIDAMDNTLAGAISPAAIKQLGVAKDEVLAKISEVVSTKIGAKEFVVLPKNVKLNDYVAIEDHDFKRNRHTTLVAMQEQSALVTAQHPELAKELDSKLRLVSGINQVISKVKMPYKTIFALLEDHANFTDGKMQEYKSEDIQGLKARLHNERVHVVALLDQDNKPQAIIRNLSMGEGFGYLSDEVINHNIVALDHFAGDSVEEQEDHRNKFLLAYFVSKAATVLKDSNYLFIAAAGREDEYKVIGSETLPLNNPTYYAAMKFGAPGKALANIKNALTSPIAPTVRQQGVFANNQEIDAVDMQVTPTMKK